MIDFPGRYHSMPPGPPPLPPGPPSKVIFFLKFSQEIQSLQSGHHPDHPKFDQIQNSSSNLLKQMTDNEPKIRQLCEQKGWTFDETNTNFNTCIDALKEAQNANPDNPASLESAQSASGLAEKIFNHINPSG